MESENGRSYFFRDLIVKILLVLLFIFLLMWLLPMPNLNPFYDKIFTENMESMKDAAKGYYTVSRLPKNEGESSKLTLKDMIDNKMIIEFTDSKGNKCDVNKSYVEVTKKDGEYTFKTNLSCGSDEDYVIEYFGCYDVCTDGKCQVEVVEKPSEEVKKIIEYEFSKTNQTKYIEKYLCKTGYTLQGSKCVLKTSIEKQENANIKCLSGYNYNSSTKKCEKVVTKEENATLVCPTGYVYATSMNKCIKGEDNVVNADVLYKCANGVLDSTGTKCIISGTKQENATISSYTCPNGGSLNGTTCAVSHTTQNPSVCNYTNWVCSNVSYATQIGSSSTDTYTRNYLYKSGNNFIYQVCTRQYSCSGGGSSTSYTYYEATPVYTCSNGTLDGTKCIIPTSTTVNATKEYKCSVGTLNGTTCEITNILETKPTYTCKNGTIDGTKCIIGSIDKVDPTYYCTNGYTLAGNMCYMIEDSSDIVNATPVYKTKTETVYKWSRSETLAGWTRTGKTRTVNVTVTSK